MSSSSAETESSAPTAVKERYQPRGDLVRVRQEVVMGLSAIASVAAHEGGMFIHAWINSTAHGKNRDGMSEDVLINAEACLRVALTYVSQLREEIVWLVDAFAGERPPQPALEHERPEMPF